MSAIGAIFNFNEKPLEPERLLSLWNDLATRGPDGGNFVTQRSFGLCYRAFHTNRESRLENQPLVSVDGRILAADLRIDNREELITQLRDLLPGERIEITDVQIVIAAHQRWGDMFPARIIGEYALVLWNPADRTILMARDHIGARTLYYHTNRDRLICSSEIIPLLDTLGDHLGVNDEYIAGYLAFDPDPELTPYKGIHAVKPFHLITISAEGRVKERAYWKLDTNKEIRYRRDTDYEEDFYRHLVDAVRAPLRSDRPVFADLSGGLDSSTIVCIADRLLASGEVAAPRVETVSQVFNTSSSADERRFIQCVEEHRGQRGHHLAEEDHPLLSAISRVAGFCSLNPLYFCAEQHRGIHELMLTADARVLLAGIGGDEITCSYDDPSPELADLLRRGQLQQLYRRTIAWSRHQKRPYLDLLWRNAVIPTLPRKVQVKFRSAAPLPIFFSDKFSKRMSIKERMVAPANPFKCSLPSSADQAIGFWTAVRGIAAGYRREMGKVDVSYPFLHRPLVEFMQAIPYEQRVRIGESRSLMRRALKGVVPAKILKRKSKGDPHEAVSRAIAREWPRLEPLFADARVYHYGYIDRAGLESAIERFRCGCGMYSPALFKTIALEIWLRGLECRETSAKRDVEWQKSTSTVGCDQLGPRCACS